MQTQYGWHVQYSNRHMIAALNTFKAAVKTSYVLHSWKSWLWLQVTWLYLFQNIQSRLLLCPACSTFSFWCSKRNTRGIYTVIDQIKHAKIEAPCVAFFAWCPCRMLFILIQTCYLLRVTPLQVYCPVSSIWKACPNKPINRGPTLFKFLVQPPLYLCDRLVHQSQQLLLSGSVLLLVVLQ